MSEATHLKVSDIDGKRMVMVTEVDKKNWSIVRFGGVINNVNDTGFCKVVYPRFLEMNLLNFRLREPGPKTLLPHSRNM